MTHSWQDFVQTSQAMQVYGPDVDDSPAGLSDEEELRRIGALTGVSEYDQMLAAVNGVEPDGFSDDTATIGTGPH